MADENVDAYLDGRLEGRALADFEVRLLEDPAFAMDVLARQNVRRALIDVLSEDAEDAAVEPAAGRDDTTSDAPLATRQRLASVFAGGALTGALLLSILPSDAPTPASPLLAHAAEVFPAPREQALRSSVLPDTAIAPADARIALTLVPANVAQDYAVRIVDAEQRAFAAVDQVRPTTAGTLSLSVAALPAGAYELTLTTRDARVEHFVFEVD